MLRSLSSSTIAIASVATTLTAAFGIFGYHMLSDYYTSWRIVKKLPLKLDTWRVPGTSEEEQDIWNALEPVFRGRRIYLWRQLERSVMQSPGPTSSYPLASGFLYVTPERGFGEVIGGAGRFRVFNCVNSLFRIARTQEGYDVFVRIVVLKNQGQEHLKILRKLATGPNSLLSNNHSLPMLDEVHFDTMVFGIFPKVGNTLWNAWGSWTKNSVGDIVDMLMQALEALAFIHDMNIAHRDAYRDNFLVQWQPESMRTMTVSVSRPRVYLIDFEVAIEFPPECPLDERTSTGLPLGGSLAEAEKYGRPHAPEMMTGEPYSPFKLDVWQLGKSFSQWRLQTTIPAIDEILDDMVCDDSETRMSAGEALARLRKVVHSMPPESLLIEPLVDPENLW